MSGAVYEVRFYLLNEEQYIVSMRSKNKGGCVEWADELRKRRRHNLVTVNEVIQ